MLIKRKSKSGADSFLTNYRPCSLSEFLGNTEVKRMLSNYLEQDNLPHCLLFTGPAGTGKTTLARILALSLNCKNPNGVNACMQCDTCKRQLNLADMDVLEVNVGSNNGKSAVESIIQDLSSAPFDSKYKVIIFDECHKLTDAAKDLLKKPMEDCYDHVYLIFCTNEPEKLVEKKVPTNGQPFLDRFNAKVQVQPLSEDDMHDLLVNVSEFEGAPYTQDVLDYIITYAKGVPRLALQCLGNIIAEGSWDLNNIQSLVGEILIDDDDPEVLELCKALLSKNFKLSCTLFDKITKNKPVESVRVGVCGYFVGCLKRSPNVNLSNAISQLTTPIYLTGKPAEHLFYNIMFKVVTYLGK